MAGSGWGQGSGAVAEDQRRHDLRLPNWFASRLDPDDPDDWELCSLGARLLDLVVYFRSCGVDFVAADWLRMANCWIDEVFRPGEKRRSHYEIRCGDMDGVLVGYAKNLDHWIDALCAQEWVDVEGCATWH